MSTYEHDTPSIFVVSLHAYNEGRTGGEWIDIDEHTTEDEVWEAISEVLVNGGGEEHAIFDIQGFGNYKVGEYDSISDVVKIAHAIAEHGLAFAAYLDNIGDLDSALASFEDAYRGEWKDEKDFAYNLADGLGIAEDDSITSRYFDWDAWTRDLFMDGYTSVEAPGYQVWVFDDNV